MEEIVNKLINLSKTISTMESCTGGAVVNAITNISGASSVLKYSAVTYSNEFKIKMGVDENIINEYSVYSMETAKEMSKKISIFTDSDYGIGVTGKLKRSDPNNLVGEDDLVFVSIYDKEKDIFHELKLQVQFETRIDNKNMIINEISKKLLSVIN